MLVGLLEVLLRLLYCGGNSYNELTGGYGQDEVGSCPFKMGANTVLLLATPSSSSLPCSPLLSCLGSNLDLGWPAQTQSHLLLRSSWLARTWPYSCLWGGP